MLALRALSCVICVIVKAVSKSVSMTEALWAAVDSHADDMGEDRSDYIRRLVHDDLTAAGKMPKTPRNAVRELAIAAAELAGERRVLEVLENLKAEALADKAANMA